MCHFQILAHRANLSGPNPTFENSLNACKEALEQGFGLEIDLRRDDSGAFYIAHDLGPRNSTNDFAAYTELFRRWPDGTLAVNVKELGYEEALVQLWLSGDLGRAAFYFDFELLEPDSSGMAQRRLRTISGGDCVPLASRLSDRGESIQQCLAIPAEVVWADEFDELWLRREHVEAVHAAGRRFFAISPELHGFSEADRLRRWSDFKEWGINGLCTDFALSAREFFLS